MCTHHNHGDTPENQDGAHSHADQHVHSHSHSHSPAKPGRVQGDLAVCPVMTGNTVVKSEAESHGLFRDYNGTRYYLCCDTCLALFTADPEKYAAAAH
jgi:YHS domain-containing protein